MTATPDQRHAQIIEAARSIIERDGATRLTAASVAQAVGVSRPLLYHYFANMDELVEEVVRQYVSEFETRFEAWYASHADDPIDTGLADCAEFVHEELDQHCPAGIDGPLPGPDGHSRPTYLARCSQIVADGLADKDGRLSASIREAVPYPAKTLRVLVLGLCQYQQARPETTVDEIRQIVSSGFGFGVRSPQPAATPAAPAPAPAPVSTPDEAPKPAKEERKRGFFERFLSGR